MWEIDKGKSDVSCSLEWARNPQSKNRKAREWHFVQKVYLAKVHNETYVYFNRHTWEVDWSNPNNTGTVVLARNPKGHSKSSREWHMVATGFIRQFTDIKTPVYRADSWEVDWSKRDIKNKLVWARNTHSKMPEACEWHWIGQSTLNRSGMAWKPAVNHTGRHLDVSGYVILTKRYMTEEEIKLAELLDLFRGAKKRFVKEHRLVAAKKYGERINGMVVRHVNGIKDDNRPENLVIGTTQENTMDHNTARIQAMYWHQKYEELLIGSKIVKSGEAVEMVRIALGGER